MTTNEQRLATGNVLRNIANLIRKGLFFGENAGYVQEALGFLDQSASDLCGEKLPLKAVPTAAPKKKGKPTNGS